MPSQLRKILPVVEPFCYSGVSCSLQGDSEWRRYSEATPANGNSNSNSELDHELEWELRVGISEDSSVSVSEGGGSGMGDRLEDMGFEVEHAQSV